MGTEVTKELQLEQQRQACQGYLDYESNGSRENNTHLKEKERERGDNKRYSKDVLWHKTNKALLLSMLFNCSRELGVISWVTKQGTAKPLLSNEIIPLRQCSSSLRACLRGELFAYTAGAAGGTQMTYTVTGLTRRLTEGPHP